MLQTNFDSKKESKKRIKTLLIEDCYFTRTGLRFTIDRYTNAKVVAQTSSIEESLETIKKTKPDVIILNFEFKEDKNSLSIKEAIQKIKDVDKNTKIIILTTSKDQHNVLDALQMGINAYCIRQDLETQTLSMVIDNAYKGAFWIDPKVTSLTMKSFQKLAELFPKIPTVKLTERELEVLKYIVKGKSNPEIAKELIVSVHTAKAHVTNILQKMEVKDRVQAAVKAIRLGLI